MIEWGDFEKENGGRSFWSEVEIEDQIRNEWKRYICLCEVDGDTSIRLLIYFWSLEFLTRLLLLELNQCSRLPLLSLRTRPDCLFVMRKWKFNKGGMNETRRLRKK